MGVLLYIYYKFSEYLFKRTPLEGCFCLVLKITKSSFPICPSDLLFQYNKFLRSLLIFSLKTEFCYKFDFRNRCCIITKAWETHYQKWEFPGQNRIFGIYEAETVDSFSKTDSDTYVTTQSNR